MRQNSKIIQHFLNQEISKVLKTISFDLKNLDKLLKNYYQIKTLFLG